MTDGRSQELLEFPQIRTRLAALTAFAPSRRLAEAIEPSSEALVVNRWLDETDEARDILGRRPDLGVGGAHDIITVVLRAKRGGRLSGTELLQVLETLIAAGRLADALRDERPPQLHELGRSIKALPQLRAKLEGAIDPNGEILDSASPALGGLRRAVRVAYERLRTRLESIVHGELGAAL
ncbi:MAG: endonuclease MutS2, partial [Candidatus Limnocylindrales bacterium]